MTIWKPARAVFVGGTQAIKALSGTHIRTRNSLNLLVYDPDPKAKIQVNHQLFPNAVGIVSYPHPTMNALLAVFSKGAPVDDKATLDSLRRANNFIVVVINDPTFKQQFEVRLP